MMRSIRPQATERTGLATGCRQRVELFPGSCGMLLLSIALITGCEPKQSVKTNPVGGTQTSAVADATASANGEAITGEEVVSEKIVTENQDNVLRHAVFFSFQENSAEEDINGVIEAFAALPGKIDSIMDFQWGVNNSPEDLNDGFTHGFLLTFKDLAGRAEYLPHPAHTGEFADTLRPHMKDVFVLDYWGTPVENGIKKELKHAVFFKFKDDADAAEVSKVEQAFAALPSKIDSIKAFEWGTNNSPESHDDGFTHCFMVTFDSEAGREAYLPHPDHLAFVEILKPVLDKVRVIDFWERE